MELEWIELTIKPFPSGFSSCSEWTKWTEMSVSIVGRFNELDKDVLLMIFQQLEGEDLLNCEAVCRQWREILLAGTPWRRLFYQNKASSPL